MKRKSPRQKFREKGKKECAAEESACLQDKSTVNITVKMKSS